MFSLRPRTIAGAAVILIAAVFTLAAILLHGGDEPRQVCPRAIGEYCSIPPVACAAEGNADANPTDRTIAPMAGERLIPPGPHGPQIGFNDAAVGAGQLPPAQDARLTKRVGATLSRYPLEWAKIEPEPGVLDLSLPDAEYCADRAAGIRPVLELATTPEWAADPSLPCGDPCLAPPSPEHLLDLGRFAELVASRYPQSAAVEVWNEPNLSQFFPSPNPLRYTQLLRTIYTGVKDTNPSMPVLGGSLSGQPTNDPVRGNYSAATFLNAMYDAGAARYMDGVSIHPYPVYPLSDQRELFDSALARIRFVIAARSPEAQPHVWITEVGVSTSAAAGALSQRFPPSLAATTLLQVYRRAAEWHDVDAVLFHTLIEPGAGVASPPGVGWLQPDGSGGFTPTPVYCTFAAIFAKPIPSCGSGTVLH